MDDNVNPNDPSTGTEKPEEKVDVGALQQELAAEKAARTAAEKESARWHEAATAKPVEKAVEKKEEAPDLDDLSEADLVEIVSGNDKSKFSRIVRAEAKKLLKEMAVTSKDDVEQLVSGRLSERESAQTGMARLVADHPDLQDDKSDLYKEAQRQLEELGKDASLAGVSDFGKVKMAVKLADAALARSEKQGEGQEKARAARISAQQGSTGARNRSTRDEHSDELNEEEQAAARIFGITEDDFKKNKKEQKMFR
jgi:glycerol-3-phosphate cytidylyltransferase-like family protein